jgi:hypothetical protein
MIQTRGLTRHFTTKDGTVEAAIGTAIVGLTVGVNAMQTATK